MTKKTIPALFITTLVVVIITCISSNFSQMVNGEGNLTVVSHSSVYVPPSVYMPYPYLNVYGEIKNTGTIAVTSENLTIVYYDSSDHIVATSAIYPSIPPPYIHALLPDRTWPFSTTLFGSEATNVDHYELTDLNWTDYPSGKPLGLQILSSNGSITMANVLEITGQIKNVGTGISSGLMIYAVLYNAKGTVVHTAQTYLSTNLNPNEVGDFDIICTGQTVHNATSYMLTAESYEYAVISEQFVVLPIHTGTVSINSHSNFLDTQNSLHVVGEVQNNRDVPTRFIEIEATFYNASNEIVNIAFGYADVNVLLQGTRSPFEILLTSNQGSMKVHNYSLVVSFGDYASGKSSSLEILTSYSYVAPSTGYLRVNGTIRNNGTQVSEHTRVYVTFYDTDEVVVGKDQIEPSPSNLNPEQIAVFEAELTYLQQISKVATYRVTTESDQYSVSSEQTGVIPEFPSTLTSLLILMIITTVASFLVHKKKP